MKRLIASVALAGLAALTVTFGAGTSATLNWQAPTEYTDGSPIQSGDIAYYTVNWAPAAGQSGPSGSLQTSGPVLTATVPVPCGAVSFTVTVTSSGTAKYPNTTSAPTNPVPYASGVTCAPNPPTGLAVH